MNNYKIIPQKQEVWIAYRPTWKEGKEKEEETKGVEERCNYRPGLVISDSGMNINTERVALLPITDIYRKYCGKKIEKKKKPPFSIEFEESYGEIQPGYILCGQINTFISSLEKRGKEGCLVREKGSLPSNFIKDATLELDEILDDEPDTNISFQGLKQGSIIQVNYGNFIECVVISNTSSIKKLRYFNKNDKKWHHLVTVLRTFKYKNGDELMPYTFILDKNIFNLFENRTIFFPCIRTIDAEERINKKLIENKEENFEIIEYLPQKTIQNIINNLKIFLSKIGDYNGIEIQ